MPPPRKAKYPRRKNPAGPGHSEALEINKKFKVHLEGGGEFPTGCLSRTGSPDE